MGNILRGKVIKVIDEYKLVINRGSDDGVTKNDKFLIYHLGEELFDPDTKESLGELEIVCGEGKPEHIQLRVTTLVTAKSETTKSKTVIKRSGLDSAIFGRNIEETYSPETVLVPFENPDVGYLAKQIR